MEEIQQNLHQHFPSLPQNALKKIYKARCERLRLLMINGIPADICWLIEAKVRLAGEFSDHSFPTCLVLVKVHLLRKEELSDLALNVLTV